MRPEGHFITAVVAGAGVYALTHSWETTAACFFGGFLIDLDHYFDYVVFDKQYSLNPFRFLRYYLEGRYKKLVLALHSLELMALLGLLAYVTQNGILIAYLLGAGMHLILDIIFNGNMLRSPLLFYFFAYRTYHHYRAQALVRFPITPRDSNEGVPLRGPKSAA